MHDHPLAYLRLPPGLLIALDSRMLHFWMQPVHHLVRMAHLMAMAAFFGGIMLLDLRLLDLRLFGRREALRLRPFAGHVLPALHVTCAVTLLTGLALFLYDPLHVGSHAYFVPKLALILAGGVNAALYHRAGYVAALAAEARLPLRTRIAAALSLAIWSGVLICASLNTEAAPRVMLRWG